MGANHGQRDAEPALQFKCWCARPAPLAGIEVGFSRGSASPAPVSASNWATKCASHASYFTCSNSIAWWHSSFHMSQTWVTCSRTAPIFSRSWNFASAPCTAFSWLRKLFIASSSRRLFSSASSPFFWMSSSTCSYNSFSHSNSLDYSASATRSGWASHSLQFSASRRCISSTTGKGTP